MKTTGTNSFNVVLNKLARVDGMVSPLEGALTVLLTLKVTACKLRSITPGFGSLTVLLILDPIARIAELRAGAYIVPS